MLGAHRHTELRRRAIEAVDAELGRLAAQGPGALRALASESPTDSEREGLVVTTHVDPDGDLLLVLVEAWQGKRMLATGGFSMRPDGTTHTPH